MTPTTLTTIIRLFTQHPDREDKSLMKMLAKNGIDEIDAQKYILFFPIALGREYLKLNVNDLTFSDSFFYTSFLKKTKLLLAEDEIYLSCAAFAKKHFEETILSEAEYIAIVTRSPEIKSFIKVRERNESFEGAKLQTDIWVSKRI